MIDALLGPNTRSTESILPLIYRALAMPPFKLDAVYSPTADQPKAIEALANGHRARATAA